MLDVVGLNSENRALCILRASSCLGGALGLFPLYVSLYGIMCSNLRRGMLELRGSGFCRWRPQKDRLLLAEVKPDLCGHTVPQCWVH